MDRKDFIKAKELYKRKDVKGLRKHIYSLDTSPLEVVMNLISIQDRPFFDKMYPNTRGGEFLANISYDHRNLDENIGDKKDFEKKMKGAKLKLKMGDTLDEAVADLFVKKGDVNKIAVKIAKSAKGLGLKSGVMGNQVRVKGSQKNVNDFMRAVIGKSSLGGPSEVGTSNPQIDKLLNKQLKEDGHTDVSSAIRQCKTITEDAMQIMGKLKSMSGEDSLPSWWTNKLAVASNSMNKIRDYLLVPSDGMNEQLQEAMGDLEDMKKVVAELEKASKMHLAQSKRIAAHIGMMDKKEEIDEGKMKQMKMYIDDIASAMKKDRNMKPFVQRFVKDAEKTLNPKKSLEKVLPDYIPGKDIAKLLNMGEQIDERVKLPRQLIDKNKEIMIVKNNKVIVVDKKDKDKYMRQGWELAERELTPRELKRREEIAKKLDLKDFEKRYGKDKGMGVKMAVATKMAKKETEEGVKFYRDITRKDLLENKYKDAKNGAQHFS